MSTVIALSGLTDSAAAGPARPADAFVDSVGVNTHLSYGSTSPYRNYAVIEAKLTKLGVRHIREGVHSGQTFHHQELRRLAGMGIKTNVIVGDPLQRWGIGPLTTQMALIRKELPVPCPPWKAPTSTTIRATPTGSRISAATSASCTPSPRPTRFYARYRWSVPPSSTARATP